jgi:hypothetical protein
VNAIAPYFSHGAFAEIFGRATPVSGRDNFDMSRAQSILTGDLLAGQVCPPLTPDQARDVLRWHGASHD